MAPTPNKGRKSMTLWLNCSECKAVLHTKDVEGHKMECNSIDWNWKHNFIKDNILHSSVEIQDITDNPFNISEKMLFDMAFMSESAMQMCNISLGDPVMLSFKDNHVVKKAWSVKDKFLTGISVIRPAIDLDHMVGCVTVQKLTAKVYHADEITIRYRGKHKLPPLDELTMLLRIFNEGRRITNTNKITCSYYYKTFTFDIVKVKSKQAELSQNDFDLQLQNLNLSDNDTSNKLFYVISSLTDWKVEQKVANTSKVCFKYRLEDVGGYKELISDIQDVIGIGVGKFGTFPESMINKGILLHGSPGVGKTMIAEAILSELQEIIIVINFSLVYSKLFREIETSLVSQFQEAKTASPSVIYIEDLDTLFQKKSNNDHERKILMVLTRLLDEISTLPIAVLATTSKLETIDNSLRRPGRLDKEFEVIIPNPEIRRQIIEKMLRKVNHSLNTHDISYISFVTHGYVGTDLHGLNSQAISNAIKRTKNTDGGTVVIKLEDFIGALNTTSPSAMKEVLVEVSNVRWDDIGGQEELKLKLKQAVEWPLKHPEVFRKMGIVPPRGVLMYGPPGCSKTMIAKALATESKLNFLNIKGSELFSKWVGESEKAVREVFRKARQVAPSIIFIDEIDAIGGERSTGSNGGGSNVQERVVAQMLTELDGVTALGNVTLIAATNRPDKIDKALLRPGRLDRIIYVPLPDKKTREEIFTVILRKMPLAKDVNLSYLVNLTDEYSGAEIQAVCHEAAINALEKNLQADQISMENFRAALDIVRPRTPKSLIELYESYNSNKYL